MSITQSSTGNKWSGGNNPQAIVIHWWGTPKGQQLDSIISWFQNPASSVSAHYIVSDTTVVKMMDELDRAWHSLQANGYTIGIEVDPNLRGSTYQTVGELVRDIRSRQGDLPLLPHSYYVNTACPGTIDLNLIERYAQGNTEDMNLTTFQFFYLRCANRYPRKDEIDNQLNKVSMDDFRAYLENLPEGRQTDADQERGAIARAQNWAGQINDLQTTIKQLNERIAQMAVQMDILRKDTGNKELADALQKRLDDTSTELEKTTKELKDVKLEREEAMKTGNRFIEWIGGLFKK